ncbi:MAG: tripartite tricarboxylate transporter TctB family protein [Firmicutes bacterium]|nr:tripartite tricarboxylate transporter TctB family protein [Bacillota bacterium]
MDHRSKIQEQYDAAKKDLFVGLLLFLVFAAIFIGSFSIKTLPANGNITARFFPILISCIGMGLSLALAATNGYKMRSLKKELDAAGTDETAETPKRKSYRWGMVCISIVLMGVYIFLISILGFVVSSALYLFAQILILEQNRTLKRILMIAAISIAIPLLIYFPFRYIFYLIFPVGIFGF